MMRWVLRIVVCLILGAVTTVAVAWACAILVDVYVPSAILPGKGRFEDSSEEWRVYRRSAFGASTIHSERSSRVPPDKYANGDSDLHPTALLPEQSSLREFKPAYWLLHQPVIGQIRIAEVDEWPAVHDWLRTFGVDAGWTGILSDSRTHDFRGWPWRCLWSELVAHGEVGDAEVRGGLMTSMDPFELAQDRIPRALPLRPIWPGLFINTLFYAAVWFGVLLAPRLVKRAIRRRQGRCTMCGYDLRGQREAISRQPSPVSQSGCPECGWNQAEKETERLRDGETK